MPASASSARTPSKATLCSRSISWTRLRIAASCSAAGLSPGLEGAAFAWACSISPDTLIWKNSSMLLAKIARNLTRSRSGLRTSPASNRTRRWNSSELSSRLIYGNSELASRGAEALGAEFLRTIDVTLPQVAGGRLPFPSRSRMRTRPMYRPILAVRTVRAIGRCPAVRPLEPSGDPAPAAPRVSLPRGSAARPCGDRRIRASVAGWSGP